MAADNSKHGGFAWGGYLFAPGLVLAVYAICQSVGQLAGEVVALPLLGSAIVLACIWRAGVGPAILAASLTTAWYVQASYATGVAVSWIAIRAAIYAFETGVICACGKQWRIARETVADGENLRHHFTETSGEGIWIVGMDGVIRYANPRIAEILGTSVAQMTGRKAEEFFCPEDLPMERIRMQARLSGDREQYDRRLRRADGAEVWTLACSTSYLQKKKPAGVLTMMTDITERKKAEHALLRSEQKYRELFENIREGVYQTTPDGKILAANPELLRMLGFSSLEDLNASGAGRDTFVEPGVHRELHERLERDGSYANVEFRLRTRDKRLITVRENARVIRDDAGKVLYYEGTLTDITEQLRAEKRAGRLQKMEALRRFAGAIGRDYGSQEAGSMRELKQAVDGLPADGPARLQLGEIARILNRTAALTGQILEFAGSSVAGEEANDLNELVRGLEPSLRQLVAPADAFVLSLCADRTRVAADAGHLQQILVWLLVRAGEFGTSARRITVTTSIEPPGPVGTAGSLVCLAVEAESSGRIDREDSARLGMATMQAILALYGGTMTVDVDPTGGAGVPVLRYALRLQPASDGGLPPVLNGMTERYALTAVLLAEDDTPLLRELIRDMLDRRGFRVRIAASVDEAERLARLRDQMDFLVTKRSAGSEGVVRLLRQSIPALPVLFIESQSGDGEQGKSDPGQTNRWPVPDGCATLRQPFSADSLHRILRQLLNQPGGMN